MIIADWRDAPWDAERWPNFTAREVACRGSGEYFHDPGSFDALQALRRVVNAPIQLNSAHRSALHNARVGGAPLSAHLRFAADVALDGHDPAQLFRAARSAGFTSFGFYSRFLHMDRRPTARRWFGSERARAIWTTWLA